VRREVRINVQRDIGLDVMGDILDSLPDYARFVACGHDPYANCSFMIFSHDTFPEAIEGASVPFYSGY